MIRGSSGLRRLAVLLTSGIGAALLLSSGKLYAEPILVTSHVLIDSAGGDFPDFNGPINELIYSLAGAGLPSARGESLETIPDLGNRGGLQVSRSPSPQPLVAGATHSLSTIATFAFGRAFEEGWPQTGRVYDIAGEFRFTGGPAMLRPEPFDELVGRGPIALKGTLSAFDIDTRALLFRRTLRGSGIGEVTFAPANPAFFQYRYSLNPVPEPGTLFLLASGLGWMVVRRRGRRGSDA